MIISNITLETIDGLLVSRAFQSSPLERRAMSPNLQSKKKKKRQISELHT